MDSYTLISNTISNLAWPITVIVLCVVLKTPVSNLLARLSKARHKDTELNFDTAGQSKIDSINEKSNIAEKMPKDSLGLTKELEGRIYTDLENLSLNSDLEKVKVLVSHHAILQLNSGFQEYYNSIFGSQISLLHALNSSRDKVEFNFLNRFYDQAKEANLEFYSQYARDSYINFLTSSGLIGNESGKYYITQLGRGFLMYISENGLSIKRAY